MSIGTRRGSEPGSSAEGRIARDFLDATAPAIQPLLRQFRRVAPMAVAVLITGETGAGKEVLARAIHEGSPRAASPFVAVNCAALPSELLEAELFGHARGAFTGAHQRRIGKFEAAGQGTLLLDEVGDLPLALQAKLLRALQERVFEPLGSNELVPFKARLISATSRNLREAIATSNFRIDLYYRLAVVTLEMPPLRRRLEDLPSICASLLVRFAEREGQPVYRLDPAVLARLARYDWPGNIRELENALISAAVNSDDDVIRSVRLDELPMRQPDLRGHAGALIPMPVEADQVVPLVEYELMVIDAALHACDGNLSECARRLGIGRATLRRKLARGVIR